MNILGIFPFHKHMCKTTKSLTYICVYSINSLSLLHNVECRTELGICHKHRNGIKPYISLLSEIKIPITSWYTITLWCNYLLLNAMSVVCYLGERISRGTIIEKAP